MKTHTRDETEHGVEYVTLAEAEAEIKRWRDIAKDTAKDYLREGREKDQVITRLRLALESPDKTLATLDATRAAIAKRWGTHSAERMGEFEELSLYREMKAFDRVLEFYRNPRTAWKEQNHE